MRATKMMKVNFKRRFSRKFWKSVVFFFIKGNGLVIPKEWFLVENREGKLIWAWPWLFSLAQFFKGCLEAHSIEIDFRWLVDVVFSLIELQMFPRFNNELLHFNQHIYPIGYRGGRYYQKIINSRYIISFSSNDQ